MPVHIDPLGGAPLPIIDVGHRPRRVILIGVDAGRYDYLERFRVPNIERLTDRGVSFRNAVCGNFTLSAPAKAAMRADLAWAKLQTLVEGARLASTSLWP
jgi:hypothetical protein